MNIQRKLLEVLLVMFCFLITLWLKCANAWLNMTWELISDPSLSTNPRPFNKVLVGKQVRLVDLSGLSL